MALSGKNLLVMYRSDSSTAPSFKISLSDGDTSTSAVDSDMAKFGQVQTRELVSHWDAQNIENNPSTGDKVSSWNDVSGSSNDHNGTQDEETSQPTYVSDAINGHSAVEFDGVDDFFNIENHADINTNNTNPADPAAHLRLVERLAAAARRQG